MAIYAGSRYKISTVSFFNKEEYGTSQPIVGYKFDSLKGISFHTHVFTAGETLHGISQRYFRRPDLWWTVVEYNPEVVDFINIPSGTTLRIPSV
jgi:hypothetical protein